MSALTELRWVIQPPHGLHHLENPSETIKLLWLLGTAILELADSIENPTSENTCDEGEPPNRRNHD